MLRSTARRWFMIAAAALFCLAAGNAYAATMYFVPSGRVFSSGQTFTVDLKIDTEGTSTSIDAAQATVQFPTDLLRLQSVNRDTSAFNIWVQDPAIDQAAGQMSFIGGTQNGLVGKSLQVLTLTFKAIGSGNANLSITNAVVTASDGRGTNVLSTVQNASIGIGTNVVPGGAPSASGAEAPTVVTSTPVRAAGLPPRPVLRVPLYPQDGKWYNWVGDTVVLWDVPSDVSQVETLLVHTADAVSPGIVESARVTGKNFGVLAEGQWYVRVRFRNNVGWSDPVFYRINIDTTPPLGFSVAMDSTSSENPAPGISFKTSDSFSGMGGYHISVDGVAALDTASTSAMLPPQPPGKHVLIIRASDVAGNAVESSVPFEVVPLPNPTFLFVTPSLSQGEPFFASGHAPPGSTIDLRLLDPTGHEVFKDLATADGTGGWEATMQHDIPWGRYTLSIVARDARGATSLPVASPQITVRDQVVFSFGPFYFGWFEIALVVTLLAIAIFCVAVLVLYRRAERRQAFEIVAVRDVQKMGDELTRELDEIEKRIKDVVPNHESFKTEAGHFIQEARKTVQAMKKYLGKEIEDEK